MSRFPWRTLLFVSVALNLLLIGLGVGLGLGAARDAAPAVAEARMAAPRAIIAALPQSARGQIRQKLVEAWRQSSDERGDLRAANADVVALLRADTYDAAAMRAALARQRQANTAATAVFHDAAAESFAELTPDQRRAVADALAHPLLHAPGARLRRLRTLRGQ